MNVITQLWLPILATAVLVFAASSLIHMVFKWHHRDYGKLAGEESARAALRGTPPGMYVLPHCLDMKEMASEGMKAKFTEGPIAFVTVRPNGMPSMGTPLALWFIQGLVIAGMAGAMALHAFAGNAASAAALVGVVTFMSYASGGITQGIWYGKPWPSVGLDVLDSLIYAAVSFGVFKWLWP